MTVPTKKRRFKGYAGQLSSFRALRRTSAHAWLTLPSGTRASVAASVGGGGRGSRNAASTGREAAEESADAWPVVSRCERRFSFFSFCAALASLRVASTRRYARGRERRHVHCTHKKKTPRVGARGGGGGGRAHERPSPAVVRHNTYCCWPITHKDVCVCWRCFSSVPSPLRGGNAAVQQERRMGSCKEEKREPDARLVQGVRGGGGGAERGAGS